MEPTEEFKVLGDEKDLRQTPHVVVGLKTRFQYFSRHLDPDSPPYVSGWYYWPVSQQAGFWASEAGPYDSLQEAILDATREAEELALQKAPQHFEGMYLEYRGGGTPGWYYSRAYSGVPDEEEFGPFETYAQAAADITDRPLREHAQRSGPWAFQYIDGAWSYWRTGPNGGGDIFRPFTTFPEALAHSQIDPSGGPIEAPSELPLDSPGEGEDFSSVLSTLLNQFDWRRDSGPLQGITRPFAALAFVLARSAPHPYWTERAIAALMDARTAAVRAWAYVDRDEPPGESGE